MRIANRRYRVDWGHLGVVAAIVAICVAYLYDTLTTSLDANNILFVLPASLVSLGLCLVIVPQTFERLDRTGPKVETNTTPTAATSVETEIKAPPGAEGETESAESASNGESRSDLARIFALMAGFGLYVFLLERIGFDVASWLFILLGLAVCGERRPLTLAIYPPVAAALIVLGFHALIPYPLYTLIL